MHRFDHHKSRLALAVDLYKSLYNQQEINMSIELKIKSKHLSLEAKVIRFEEQKLKKRIK